MFADQMSIEKCTDPELEKNRPLFDLICGAKLKIIFILIISEQIIVGICIVQERKLVTIWSNLKFKMKNVCELIL